MSDEPRVNLTFERALCPMHGEPFREGWPAGYVQWLLPALDAVMAQEGFKAYASGEVEKVNRLLDQKPLCCRLSAEKLLELYVACGVGKRSVCNGCSKLALGTPYGVMSPTGPSRYRHLCFVCVVHSLRMGSPPTDPEVRG